MDVNELNKISVTALFSKLAARPNAGAGAGNAFASLLGQANATDLLPGVSEDKQPVKNKSADGSEAKVREDNSASKNKEAAPAEKNGNKKIEAKKTAKADNGKAAVENNTVDAIDESVSGEDKKAGEANGMDVMAMMMVPVAEPLAPIAEAGGVNPSEAAIAVDGAMADGAAFEGAGTVGVEAGALPADSINILDADGHQIEAYSLTPADLIKLPKVQIVDGATGQVNEMSGVQLAAQLFGVEDANQALVAAGQPELTIPAINNENVEVAEATAALPQAPITENKDFVNQLKEVVKTAVVENVEQAPIEETGTADLANAAAVKAAGHQSKTEMAPLVNDEDGVATIDGDAELQAAKLDEMLNGQQLKVDVKVSEEKIAYRSGQDLVKDRLALDKAVAAATDEMGANNALTPAAVNNSATTAQAAMPLAMPAQTTAPIAAQTLVAAADDAAPQAAGITEISSVSTNAAGQAAGASVSEFVNAAKAEANTKMNDSFRDVYKGMSKEVVDQVKVNITKSAVKGVDTIDVHLKPEDLGRIEVKMQIKDGKLQAHIISSRPETMEALQKEAQTLERAFNDAGFQTDENSLTFSFQNDGGQTNQRQENELRNFIGEVFETEANSELLSAEAANQNWTAEKGLNIKV